MTDDKVNSPSHYIRNGVECIDVIKLFLTPEEYEGYIKGNILKYLFRYKGKGNVQDLHKAKKYLDYLIEIERTTDES